MNPINTPMQAASPGRVAIRKLWTWTHAVVALVAWTFILVVLSLGLLSARSAVDDNAAYVLIVLFVVVGHLSAASYLVRRIRDDLRAIKASPA